MSRGEIAQWCGQPTSIGLAGRPLSGWRVLFAGFAVLTFVSNVVLLLSDRAPGILNQLSKRLESSDARVARATSNADLAAAEFVVHVAVWAGAAIVVGFAMWSWRSLLGGAGIVVLASALLEVAQSLFTAIRSAQLEDLVANVVGVTGGTSITAAVWLLIERRRWPIPSSRAVAVKDVIR